MFTTIATVGETRIELKAETLGGIIDAACVEFEGCDKIGIEWRAGRKWLVASNVEGFRGEYPIEFVRPAK